MSSVLPTPVVQGRGTSRTAGSGPRVLRGFSESFPRPFSRLILTDHAFRQFLTHVKELLTLALHHFRHRDAGRAGHHFSDFLSADACRRRCGLSGDSSFFTWLASYSASSQAPGAPILEFREALVLSVPTAFVHLAADLIDLVAGFLFADRVRLLALPDLFEV